jgi:hypothetical protein
VTNSRTRQHNHIGDLRLAILYPRHVAAEDHGKPIRWLVQLYILILKIGEAFVDTKTGELTWTNVDLRNAEELAALDEQEIAKARTRAKEAIEHLQRLGILDDRGRRIRIDLPHDMEDSKTDFGG